MRYEVHAVTLDEDHPRWPNSVMYKIKDRINNYVTFTGYTDESYAQKVVDDLNRGIGWIT